MFSKLAVSNVKKSVRDYTVYFLTLTLGILLFYVFNSIGSQRAMMQINETQHKILDSLELIMSYLSVFVSIVLGFLVIYANKFLIKRRKKELGLYMLLGMEKRKISFLIIGETLVIGIFALAIGLGLGVLASQGLSVLTAKLFMVNLKSFQFIFSNSAFYKTLLYFGVIFLVVMLFNTITISKCKLIDLITAAKKNETLRLRRIWLSVIVFLAGVACIGVAYAMVLKNGLFVLDERLGQAILLGMIGTFLFFFALSGFLLRLVQSSKRLYYKNLNMFVLRQVNSRVNTAFVSMAVICLMLFFTMGTLSTGMGVADVLTRDLQRVTPFDVTMNQWPNRESGEMESLYQKIAQNDPASAEKIAGYNEMILYHSQISYGELLHDLKLDIPQSLYENMKNITLPALRLSDYNRARELQGLAPITLEENQFAINCDNGDAAEYIRAFLETGRSIPLGGGLTPASREPFAISYQTSTTAEDTGTLIVPDSALQGAEIYRLILNINLKEGISDEDFVENLDAGVAHRNWLTRDSAYEQGASVKTIVSYVIIYIGIVFLIACAAVLALQQLSEAADNVQRYGLLRKLGAENKMVNRALFSQIFIAFMMPLGLAIIHAVVGIKVANDAVSMLGNLDIFGTTLFTALFVLVVYGGYFLATYFGCRNMIRQKNG